MPELPTSPPLPVTTQEFDALRTTKRIKTINQYVEEIVRVLINDEKYRALMLPIYKEQSPNGSLNADDIIMSQMIQAYAREQGGDNPVITEKLGAIRKAQAWVLEKHKLSRRQRRDQVTGENNGNGNGSRTASAGNGSDQHEEHEEE
jgi:hypothetical protein